VAADRLVGLSPEGLEQTLPLAGIASRAIAGVIDLAVAFVLIVLVSVAFDGDGVAAAVRAILIFLILFFLPILFDVLDSGRGVGKRVVGLRVVTLRGGPIRARTSAIRNLLRIVDFLPTFYLVGGSMVLFSQTGQRLGDLAAGTVVTFTPGRIERKKKKKASTVTFVGAPVVAPPTSPLLVAEVVHGVSVLTVDATRVSAAEAGLVQSFLARRATLPEAARIRLAADIAGRLRPNVVGISPDVADEDFLEILARVKAARR
jgi:uncharacterized RDD family membrane protein YckC